jgi:hypothetical protein
MALADVCAPFPNQSITVANRNTYVSDNKGFIRNVASQADLTALLAAGCVLADSGIFGAYLIETVADGVAAAGTSQATSYQIVAQQTRVATVTAGSAFGVSLPLSTSYVGLELTVINDSAVPMTVFAPGSDQINDSAGSTGVVHMPNAMVIYTCTASGKWYAEGLGTGFAPTGVNIETMSSTDLVSAAGTTSATATALTTNINRVTVNAGTPAGVTLPVAKPGLSIIVSNATATSLVIYGNGSDDIQVGGVAAAATITVTTLKTANLWCASTGHWHGVVA